MSAIPDTIDIGRTVEFCPYQETCRYRARCHYRPPNSAIESRISRRIQSLWRRFSTSMETILQCVAGVVCVLSGLVLCLTLFLIWVGIPLALLGVALIASCDEHQPGPRLG